MGRREEEGRGRVVSGHRYRDQGLAWIQPAPPATCAACGKRSRREGVEEVQEGACRREVGVGGSEASGGGGARGKPLRGIPALLAVSEGAETATALSPP